MTAGVFKDFSLVHKRWMCYRIDGMAWSYAKLTRWQTVCLTWICCWFCRYASLYFCCAVEDQDNELITLEIIHRYVELLDKYFGSVSFFTVVNEGTRILCCFSRTRICPNPSLSSQVCELDIIFNFEKAYFILDEFLLGGEAQETSKKNVLKAIEQADLLQEVCSWMPADS